MIQTMLTTVAALAILVAAGGLAFGVTGRDDARRRTGLRILQAGLGSGGLLMILGGLLGPDHDSAIYGLLLLVLGTGVTAIGARRPGAPR